MKDSLRFFNLFGYSTLLLLVSLATTYAQSTNTVVYICPMYCTDETAHKEGVRCSVCGMEMIDKEVVENPTMHKLIFPRRAFDLMKEGGNVLVLDVRSKGEYEGNEGHLDGAVLIPINELEDRITELEPYKDKTIITYCSHGIRSARAAQMLSKQGFSVFSLVGGTTKWKRERFPVTVE